MQPRSSPAALSLWPPRGKNQDWKGDTLSALFVFLGHTGRTVPFPKAGERSVLGVPCRFVFLGLQSGQRPSQAAGPLPDCVVLSIQ